MSLSVIILILEMKTIYLAALKNIYKEQYDAVQPVPYIKDRLYCVDRVFVEGGIQVLAGDGRFLGPDESWRRLKSYKNIFTDSELRTTRRILEGEPGNLVFEELNLKNNGSFSSTVIILDGYDEYPDRDNDAGNDVGQIIRFTKLQDVDVTLTTRYLPKDYSKSKTKRVKLTGFDEISRDEYIRKAVTGPNDEAAVDKIKRALKENALLDDLCQVPLFFVMFSHMTHESDIFQKFNTLTDFFMYMIKCFHNHKRNKSLDENTYPYIIRFETHYEELCQIAFEGLNKAQQQILWEEMSCSVGSKIIDYLKSRKDGDKFAILCILEKSGGVDDIKETIRELCSKVVEIGKGHSKLLQRSTVQLLQIASSHDFRCTTQCYRDQYHVSIMTTDIIKGVGTGGWGAPAPSEKYGGAEVSFRPPPAPPPASQNILAEKSHLEHQIASKAR
ncbi:hypothetical protein BSL78_16052 [Apostichopus japonicus]|uniref:NACHT domain-containing protein n=1 Tax=Stichopus japonicus TaxID=307972 RepID=A0A2G8KGG5_STIJA|nr:hypothetical protein BSL78_16052 [Apostichopus japonicus]